LVGDELVNMCAWKFLFPFVFFGQLLP